MDTLVVRLPRARAYGLFAFALVLLAVTALSDSAGRLLTAPAALVTIALAVRDLTRGSVLVADGHGVEALQGLRRLRAPWSEVEGMRVVKDRRTELLELDFGSTIAVLSSHR